MFTIVSLWGVIDVCHCVIDVYNKIRGDGPGLDFCSNQNNISKKLITYEEKTRAVGTNGKNGLGNIAMVGINGS